MGNSHHKRHHSLDSESPSQPANAIRSESPSRPATAKVLLVGDDGVGKTSLIMTFTGNVFPTDYRPIVYDSVQNIHIGDTELAIWDSAGSEEYDRLRPLSYPGTDCFLICFSVISPASFDSVKQKWWPELQQHCSDTPIVLVGTKIDMREDTDCISRMQARGQAPISYEQGVKLANEIRTWKYLECSALTMKGLKDVFTQAIPYIPQTQTTYHGGSK